MKIKILLAALLFFNQNYPYVYRVESWHYCEGKLDVQMPPKLYLLSDRHTKKRKVYPQQGNDTWDFICKTNSSFIAEVNKDKGGKPNLREIYKQLNYGNNPFDHLWMQTSYESIITSNIDFRSNNPDKIPKVLEEIANKQIETILSYKDPSLLVEYYKVKINHHQNIIVPAYRFVYNNLDRIESPEVQKNADEIIHLYCPNVKAKILDQDQLLYYLSVFYNNKIFELELLHAISEHGKKNAPSTVVYTGGEHIDSIKPILTKLGYRQYKCLKLLEKNDGLLKLGEDLHIIEPDYDPDAKRPTTTVDRLLRYIKFEHEHPNRVRAIATTILLGTIGAVSYLAAVIMSGGGN